MEHGNACLRLYNESLLTENQRDRFAVVLISPRNPLNIGAVARAMANFGFARLKVVAPYAPHWQEAKSAVGAEELLAAAAEEATLAEAVAECTLVVGTGTLTYRKPEQTVVRLPDLAPMVRQEMERGGRVALVFGPEKHGLTRDDLSYCHLLVEIPTDAKQPSMNLGQAVAVCLYELAARGSTAEGQAAELPRRERTGGFRQAGAAGGSRGEGDGCGGLLAGRDAGGKPARSAAAAAQAGAFRERPAADSGGVPQNPLAARTVSLEVPCLLAEGGGGSSKRAAQFLEAKRLRRWDRGENPFDFGIE